MLLEFKIFIYIFFHSPIKLWKMPFKFTPFLIWITSIFLKNLSFPNLAYPYRLQMRIIISDRKNASWQDIFLKDKLSRIYFAFIRIFPSCLNLEICIYHLCGRTLFILAKRNLKGRVFLNISFFKKITIRSLYLTYGLYLYIKKLKKYLISHQNRKGNMFH